MSLGERPRRGKIGFHWSMREVMGMFCALQCKSNPLSSRKLTKSDWVFPLLYLAKIVQGKTIEFTHFCSGFFFIAFVLISNRTRVAHSTDFKVTRIVLHSVQITIIIFWVSCVCICVCSLWLRIVFSLVLKRLYHLLGTIVSFFICLSAC